MLEEGHEDGKYDEKMMAAMTWCFDPHTDLHKNYFNMKLEDLMKKFTENQEWRHKLKAGNRVDVCVQLDDHDTQLVSHDAESVRQKEVNIKKNEK